MATEFKRYNISAFDDRNVILEAEEIVCREREIKSKMLEFISKAWKMEFIAKIEFFEDENDNMCLAIENYKEETVGYVGCGLSEDN